MTTVPAKFVVLAAALCLGAVARADTDPLEARVNRLESQTLVEMLTRLNQLQDQVQQLRGQIEDQGHTLDGLQQHQRELYMELDGRLRKLEQGGGAPPPATGAAEGNTNAGAAPSPNTTAPTPPPGAAAAGGEQGAYQQAFNLLKQGQYPQATQAFRDFLAHYPKSQLAGNAQYWIGEANYVTRSYKVALAEFQKVVDDYPQSGKQADALLKIGYIHYDQGEWDKARAALGQVKSKYADSSAARLATERLRKMKQEGH